MPITIPAQLQKPEFRFVLLEKQGKKPCERNWTTSSNYQFDDKKLLKHIEDGNNYGIVCGFGNLVIIDCDKEELERTIKEILPSTFYVRSGRGGLHAYYICKDIEKTIRLEDNKNNEHFGDIQYIGTQVLGPTSVHPNGNSYKIENNSEITEIKAEDIRFALRKFMAEEDMDEEEKKLIEDFPIDIKQVISLENLKQRGDEFQGTHPLHGSTTGMNFCVNIKKNVWHCFRHDSGGGPLSWLALKNGLISCEKCTKNALKGKIFKNVLEIAVKDGLIPEIAIDENKPKLILPHEGKLISYFATELGTFFSDKNVLFYRPVEDCVVKMGLAYINKKKEQKIMGFQEVKKNMLVSIVERYFNTGYRKYDKQTNEEYFTKSSMSQNIAEIVLASEQFKEKLPVIEKILNIPFPMIIDNKITFAKPGYDPEMLSWSPKNMPDIIENMELEEAKNILCEVFKEFCFKSKVEQKQINQDEINAIAALLTPFCRFLYSRETCRTPIFFYIANRERAGKDYCAGITGIIYEEAAIDDPAIVTEKQVNDEEFRKKILSTLKLGKMRIHSANNKGYINSSALEAIATSENWKDRELGHNKLLTLPNTLEISLSANTGVKYTPDLSNRSIFINLLLAEEDPNKRSFEKPDLHEWVKNNRKLIISALYALVKNWWEKGMPNGKEQFSSYPEWARVVGGIMESAGYSTPCIKNDESSRIGGDTETTDMSKLYELCYEKWPDMWILKNEIIKEIKSNDDFKELFSWLNWDYEAKSAEIKFGLLIKKYVGRIFNNITLWEIDNPKASRRKYSFSKKDMRKTLINYTKKTDDKYGINDFIQQQI